MINNNDNAGNAGKYNGNLLNIFYFSFYLSEVQWLYGNDDFSQNQLGSVQVSCHSKLQALQFIN